MARHAIPALLRRNPMPRFTAKSAMPILNRNRWPHQRVLNLAGLPAGCLALASHIIASIRCKAWLQSPPQDGQPARHVEQRHQGGGNIGPCRGTEQAPGMRQVAIDQITPPLQKR